MARVSLARDDIDAFVFWTRDPEPFAPVFDVLDRRGDPYMVLFTLTGYGAPLEPHAPSSSKAVRAFLDLADRVGPQRVVWRYDPVLFGPGLDVDTHLERFACLASKLEGATDTVVFSFVDLYQKTVRRLGGIEGGQEYVQDPVASPRLEELVAGLGRAAAGVGMSLQTCAEERVFSDLGVPPGACIDGDRLHRLFGIAAEGKDAGQRQHCRCAPSKDIGIPDTCMHGCAYCYATRSHMVATRRHATHDPASPSLLSILEPATEPVPE